MSVTKIRQLLDEYAGQLPTGFNDSLRILLGQEEPDKYKAAFLEYDTKTQWMQDTVLPHELGHHRADVLRMRIEALERRINDAPRTKIANYAAGLGTITISPDMKGKTVALVAL
jgi:hypothetical protein